MKTFGERLKEVREAAGLTQAALADASGLPLGSIRNYEQGHRKPLWDGVFKLARACGVECTAFAVCVDWRRPAKKSRKTRGGT